MQFTQPKDTGGPISRQPLHEQVADRVRDMIIEGRLPPGARVNESRLCEELGVSRTPMREAVRKLAGEGLIILRPGRSTLVRSFTAEEVKDMLDVIAELEAMAGRKACQVASDREIEEIRAVHDDMMMHFEAGERLLYFKLNQQIHSMIVEVAKNGVLAEMHGILQARMKRIRFIGHNAPQNWHDAVSEHQEMIEALSERKGDDLAAILQRHIRNTWKRVNAAI
jgi:DNA-binding GntR family transcriptional regulator